MDGSRHTNMTIPTATVGNINQSETDGILCFQSGKTKTAALETKLAISNFFRTANTERNRQKVKY